MVEQHALELTVSVEAKDVGNDVVHSQSDVDCQGQIFTEACIGHLLGKFLVLHCESQLVKDHEEVDRDVDNVNDQAAEVHLGKRTEQDGHIDQFIDALHRLNEAHEDSQCHMNKAENHQDSSLLLAGGRRWYDGLAHVASASQSQTHIAFLSSVI